MKTQVQIPSNCIKQDEAGRICNTGTGGHRDGDLLANQLNLNSKLQVQGETLFQRIRWRGVEDSTWSTLFPSICTHTGERTHIHSQTHKHTHRNSYKHMQTNTHKNTHTNMNTY